MSRARHTKEHGKKHASGGDVSSKIGNPNVFKLAEGKELPHLHGEGGKGHLGRARGGKIKAHKRASGGGADQHPYSSAKLDKGGQAGEKHGHKPLHHKAEGHESGVHHHGKHHEEHHRGRK